jgi:hypothetical protein
VTCKRAGQLRPARRPTRSHRHSFGSRSAQPRPPAGAPPVPLDRLVQRKRELQEPIAPHAQEFT